MRKKNESPPDTVITLYCSRPVDVLNWERAMFTDSNSVYLTHIAPALAAALPPSTLTALLLPFRRSSGN